jgi:hypothetical protein
LTCALAPGLPVLARHSPHVFVPSGTNLARACALRVDRDMGQDKGLDLGHQLRSVEASCVRTCSAQRQASEELRRPKSVTSDPLLAMYPRANR